MVSRRARSELEGRGAVWTEKRGSLRPSEGKTVPPRRPGSERDSEHGVGGEPVRPADAGGHQGRGPAPQRHPAPATLIVGLVMLGIAILAVLLAPVLLSQNPTTIDPLHPLAPPLTPDHLLGTDQYGRERLGLTRPASRTTPASGRWRRRIDVLIVDTAGRLHTQTHLMRELEKIRSVIQRLIPGAPHEVLLVIDATNGQNAIRQAEVFTKSIGCTGVILTKLDGTAKGGVVVAVRQTMNLPVKFIGIGEALDDLQPFDADTFVESLFL